ncbi:MAG: flagellar biosynthesis protein FlhA [Clostridia bacterium]|nr:flagellar biosynthesis protein FlhA [Clostridia bacterium]
MAPSVMTYIKNAAKHNDLAIAALILGIVIIIVVPVDPFVLDILLTISITVSIIILLTTMFTPSALHFSVFPSLLLVVTLYRLALNVASTRLILSQGSAGYIIAAFGSFVIGGNYVVGMIIFIIITVIQFVVITNGAGRVAEVAARFTLDAMPGKQMSIDADLNAGIITEQEARERRKELQREADFYGAMDGASKFVRGDAIAGIVITLVNILGGFVIGIWQMGLSLTESLQRFTILSVGDGLVSQIPALLVSTGAGILVTRAGSGENLGRDISEQLTRYPRVLALASGALFVIGLIPAIPTFPFWVLSGVTGYVSYILFKEAKEAARREQIAKAREIKSRERQPENVLGMMKLDPLEIEIGYNLVPLTDEEKGGDLLDRLAAVRRQTVLELGLYVRPIRIRDNLELDRNAYVFKIRGVEIERGEIMPDHYLAMNPMAQDEEVPGIPTKEPTFGLSAWWVTEDVKEELEFKGFTVVDASTVLITHLSTFIKKYAHELLGRQETKELIETVKETNPAVVEELIPDLMSYGQVQKVLQNLLREQVPIRDLATILEVLADSAPVTTDIDQLTGLVRQALYRTISNLYSRNGRIKVIMLDPRVEEVIESSLRRTQEGAYPALDQETAEKLVQSISSQVSSVVNMGEHPVILCSPKVRLPFKRFLERFIPEAAVVSYNELAPELEIETLGKVTLE